VCTTKVLTMSACSEPRTIAWHQGLTVAGLLDRHPNGMAGATALGMPGNGRSGLLSLDGRVELGSGKASRGADNFTWLLPWAWPSAEREPYGCNDGGARGGSSGWLERSASGRGTAGGGKRCGGVAAPLPVGSFG